MSIKINLYREIYSFSLNDIDKGIIKKIPPEQLEKMKKKIMKKMREDINKLQIIPVIIKSPVP